VGSTTDDSLHVLRLLKPGDVPSAADILSTQTVDMLSMQ